MKAERSLKTEKVDTVSHNAKVNILEAQKLNILVLVIVTREESKFIIGRKMQKS